MKPLKRTGMTLVILSLFLLVPDDVAAQSGGDADHRAIIKTAEDLSASGRFEDVIALLQPYIADHPEAVDAWIMLARHRYWTDDLPGAERHFDRALDLHPDHDSVRLAYAEFLSEIGRLRAAARVIRPVQRDDADVHALKGRIAWWRGDLSVAKNHFERTVELEPAHAEASTALDAINSASRPWFDVQTGVGDDTQPLTRVESTVRAGIFLNPLHTLAVVPSWTTYNTGPADEPVAGGTIEYSGYFPAVRTDVRLEGGGIRHLDTLRFTGRAESATRIMAGLSGSVFIERAPYLHTTASIGQSILTTRVGAGLALERPHWMGEASVRREDYPDDNRKQTAFAWLMRTLVESGSLQIDAGYAFSFEDTDDSRFVPVLASVPGPGRPPAWTGRYLPYYTPLDYSIHAVTGAARLDVHERVTFGAGGSLTVAGHEDAPFVYSNGPAPATGVYDHDIQPWEARASLTARITGASTLTLRVSHLSKTWYDATNVDLSVFVRY